MLTIEILFKIEHGQPPTALDLTLAGEAQQMIARLPSGTGTCVAYNLSHHRSAALAAGDPLDRLDELLASGLPPAETSVPISSFDAVLELTLPDGVDPEFLFTVIDGLADRLGPAVDRTLSTAAIGVDHQIIPGDGPLRLFYCMQRVRGLSHQEFSDRWRNELVNETMKTPRKSAYRQLHVDQELTERALQGIGLRGDVVDGVALTWYSDLESFFVGFDWAFEPSSGLIRAEGRIGDFARARAIMAYTSGPRGQHRRGLE